MPSVRPLYFMVGFWGERYRSYFVDYCMPSLLSPRNLGLLSAADGHRFLICTTAEDWRELQSAPLWSKLAEHTVPTLIAVGLPDDPSDTAKFRHMTLGHRLLTEAAHRDHALACQIMPDAMYSDGTIATILRHAAAGAHAVLTVALRLVEEGLFADLQARALLPDTAALTPGARPIVLQPRAIADIAVRNMFADHFWHDWEDPRVTMWPPYCFWRVPGTTDILLHSAYFAYILLDFAAVEWHNEQSFEVASIENNWLSDNFRDPALVHVLQDSDDSIVLSWTPASLTPPAKRARLLCRIPLLRALWKGFRLRCMRELHADIGDAQKANNFRHPIRWHSGEVASPQWRTTEQRAVRVMSLFFGDVYPEFAPRPTYLMKAWWALFRSIVRISPLVAKVVRISPGIVKGRVFMKALISAFRGDREMIARIRRRFTPSR